MTLLTRLQTGPLSGALLQSATSAPSAYEQALNKPLPSPAQSDTKLTAGPVTLGATASSSLAVTYASQTSNVCSVSGNTVTLLTTGTCTIEASQAGTATVFEAAPVSISFTVLAGDQTIEFPNPGTKNTSDFTGSGHWAVGGGLLEIGGFIFIFD